MIRRDKSEATEKLEGLITEFEREVIPALNDLSDEQKVKAFLQGDYESTVSASNQLKGYFNGVHNLDFIPGNDGFRAVLLDEREPDNSGCFDAVYMCILEEIKQNLGVNDRTFFYPAIGYDWRLADIWSESQIIGVDPFELPWNRPNFTLINQQAQNFEEVARELRERELPDKADVILKGIRFALTPLSTEKCQGSQYTQTPPHLRSFPSDYKKTGFQNLIEFYHTTQGLLIALSEGDIEMCERYLEDYRRIDIISSPFRRTLQKWQELEEKYTRRQMIGYWRSTTEPHAYQQES